MTKLRSLTLKRLLRRHKKNPQDEELHRTIEVSSMGKGEFLGFITKASIPKKGKNK